MGSHPHVHAMMPQRAVLLVSRVDSATLCRLVRLPGQAIFRRQAKWGPQVRRSQQVASQPRLHRWLLPWRRPLCSYGKLQRQFPLPGLRHNNYRRW